MIQKCSVLRLYWPALLGLLFFSWSARAGHPTGNAPQPVKFGHASAVSVQGRQASPYRIVATKAPNSNLKDLGRLHEKIISRFKHLPECVIIEPLDRSQIAVASGKQRGVLLAQRIKKLKASGLFSEVEPDWIMHVQATPGDVAFANGSLWGLRNTGQSGGIVGADIGAVSAWDTTTGDANVIVGIIDTGIRYTHQDLAANMWHNLGETAGNGFDDDGNGFVDDVYGINAITGSGDPMDDNGHGSHCSGTIGAVANGGGPHVGVAWQVRLMALKFLDEDGSGYSSDAITCIDYAIDKGVDILSNSWGGGGYSATMAAAVQRARDAGILFVAAAGNEGDNTDVVGSYPANYAYDNVISVAALDRRDQLASFSNYGSTTVDLGAPGVDIYSCVSSSDTAYDIYSGTSMATPHVAGVAALLVAQNPAISIPELRQRLLSTVVPVAALSGRCVTGGRVNAANALAGAADGNLDVVISSASTSLNSGETAAFYVSVSDYSVVLGASVSGGFDGYGSFSFHDDGLTPDTTGNDGVYSASLTVPSISGTADVVVNVTATGKTPATARQTFSVVGRPVNDDFVGRTLVSSGFTLVTGANQNSTLESGEPRYSYGAGSQTVWWRWTASETSAVTLSTLGSDFDTILAIYTGSSLGSLTLVGGNDDAGGLQSAVSFTAQAGVTYAIQVNGYGTAAGSIQLNFPAQAGAPSIVDEPDDVRVLVGNAFSLTVGAEGGAPYTYQWYRDGGILPGDISSTITIADAALTDEGTYQVVVSNSVGFALSREAFVAVEQVDLQPDNDRFANAQLLTGTSGRILMQNTLATGESGEPNHVAVSTPLASIWFSWTAPASGRLNINTFGSDFDTVLAVYRGDAVNALTLVEENDDASGLQSEVDFTVVGGITYRIVVDGYNDAVGLAALDYQATLSGDPVNIVLSEALKRFTPSGGTHAIEVSANVSWTAVSSASWVQITSGTSGNEDGTIAYLVTALTGSVSRTAMITVAGGGALQIHRVHQPVYNGNRLLDFDGDGRSDLGVYYPPMGKWYIFSSTDGFYEDQFGYSGTVPIAGDFDGDGLGDFGVYDAPLGKWYIFSSTDGFYEDQFGYAGTIPITGDFDGDGKCDFGCYHPPSGNWYLFQTTAGFYQTQFGFTGTIPVTGDFDGDGLCDYGYYYPPTGAWKLSKSTGGFKETSFGFANTVPITGDFDADGIDDFGVYYDQTGKWYIFRSTQGYFEDQFGYAGTVPVVGDYDGDDQADIGCYYAPGGNWYIFGSATGFYSDQFGYSGTIPLGGTQTQP